MAARAREHDVRPRAAAIDLAATRARHGASMLARILALAGLVLVFGCTGSVNTADHPADNGSAAAGPKLMPLAAAPKPAAEAQPAATSKPKSYVIQSGDQIEVRFLYHPYFNATVPVRPDGKISLQMVHDVQAAGLTPMQLWYYLTKKYQKLVDREDITVTLKSFSEAGKGMAVYVGGEVLLPKMLQMSPGMTVVQALYEAGGLRDSANTGSVLVLRHLYSQQHQVLQVNVDSVLDGTSTDIALQDRDVIYVPKTFIAKADQWVDQYLNRIVPRWVVSAFSFSYPLSTVRTQTQVIPQQ